MITGFREPEAKLRPLDSKKAKPATSMTESLKLRSQEITFASSSTGNKQFRVLKKLGTTSNKPFENLRLIITTIYALGVEVIHSLEDPVQL